MPEGPDYFYSRYQAVVLILLLLLIPRGGYSQADDLTVIRDRQIVPGRMTVPENKGFSYIMMGDSIVDMFTRYRPDDEVKVIVEFETPPLAGHITPGEDTTSARIKRLRMPVDREHQRFRRDLRAIEKLAETDNRLKRTPVVSTIRNEYAIVFNGVALDTRQWVADEISNLPYVKKVHKDRKVELLIDRSAPHIGADTVRAVHEVMGDGIVIGIIDTGIDYMHPDLGGGLGPGYKVIGGYDFVNEDDDPMDEHWHGTHVAGIVAADGEFKGVAPGASLMAYKVIHREGVGFESWILAGIERAVVDGVHLINMSLGRTGGHPDDPLSVAVDNASETGLICVVAAGNSGREGYQTITSPGVAPSALTVGATNLNDVIASFSSRGPSGTGYGVKPEILAPGMNITAPVPGEGYSTVNGTSMAAPHVAGGTALLLEKAGDMQPGRVKSIFVQSAIDLEYDIWTQGGGRIDLERVFDMYELVAEPAIINFGFADIFQDTWTTADTLIVSNYSSSPKSVAVTHTGDFPAGVEFTAFPSDLILGPGESQEVVVSVTVDNLLVPFPEEYPMSYYGNIEITSPETRSLIPAVFSKSTLLRLHFDEIPGMLTLFNEEDDLLFIYRDPEIDYELDAWIPAGNYDIIVSYDEGGTIIFREDTIVEEYTVLVISKEEAENHVQVINRNKDGAIIETDFAYDRFSHRSGRFSWGTYNTGFSERYFSDFSNYTWYWNSGKITQGGQEYYILGDGLQGCTSDVVQTYEPEDLRYIELDHKVFENDKGVIPVIWNCSGAGCISSVSDSALHLPFKQTFYISPNFRYDGLELAFMVKLLGDDENARVMSDRLRVFSSPLITINENDNLFAYRTYEDFFEGQLIEGLIIEDGLFPTGLGPPGWFGELYTRSDYLQLYNVRYLFLSQMKDWHYDDLQYRLYSDGLLRQSGKLLEDFQTIGRGVQDHVSIRIPDGSAYDVLEIDYSNFRIHERDGKATVKLGMENQGVRRYLPRMRSFNILSDGTFTDKIVTGDQNIIQFELKQGYAGPENGGFALVAAEWSSWPDTLWTLLELDNDGDLYNAAIPGYIPEGYVSLRVTAIDNSGGLMQYMVEPALYKEGAEKHLITAEAGKNGSIHPSGQIEVGHGEDQFFTEVPDEDYRLLSLKVDGKEIDTEVDPKWNEAEQQYTFTDVTRGHTIEAVFGVIGLKIYPNPARDMLWVEFVSPATGEVRVEIYNVQGRLVRVLNVADRGPVYLPVDM